MPFTKNDTNPMSWDEFGDILEKLLVDIVSYTKSNDLMFDAVAPILRSGAVPAVYIANRLQIITMLPIQVKYKNDLEQVLPFYKPLNDVFPFNPKILVVETNTVSGKSAQKAYEIIKDSYPEADLYYATIGRVFRKDMNDLGMYKHYFYGFESNELYEASIQEERELGLRPKITIYPWETVEFELEDINS